VELFLHSPYAFIMCRGTTLLFTVPSPPIPYSLPDFLARLSTTGKTAGIISQGMYMYEYIV
jgi:hypothetical protein